MQRHPKQWQAGRQQAPGEFVQRSRAGSNPACRADQPPGYCIEGIVGWALSGRPLEHLNGRQKAWVDAGEWRGAISHGTDQGIGATACAPPSSKFSETRSHLFDEKLWLLIGRKVAASVEFIPVEKA